MRVSSAGYTIDSNGVRLNPNCRPSENIYASIAKHKAKRAKGTTAEQIQAVLDN